MRRIKQISTALRTAGIVLLLLSLVLVLYATATDGKDWAAFSQKLNTLGVKTSLSDRIGFGSAYFEAMASAKSSVGQPSRARVADAARHFDSFSQKALAAQNAQLDAAAAEIETFFESGFDYEAFLEKYRLVENRNEQAEIREIFEYLDGLSLPALKSGKVLPNVKPTSSQPWFEERYAQWSGDHGEAAGSYLEFLQTIQRMVKEAGNVSNAKTFAEALFFEDYLPQLQLTLNEEGKEDIALFSDAFAGAAQQKLDGGNSRMADFLRAEYETISSRFAAGAAPSYPLFLQAVQEALVKDVNFDGSYGTLASKMRQAQAAQASQSFDSYLRTFGSDMVSNSDKRRVVPMANFTWWLASKALWVGALGIALIIFAAVLSKTASAAIIRKREYKAVPDEPDVLLRVKNLSQYFKSGDFVNKAVDDISFFIKKGEVFGLVGESGCGKTTTGRTIINLYDPTGGDVYFDGLRISSTKNGAPVMRYQLRKEYEAKVKALKEAAKERQAQDAGRAEEIARETSEQIKQLTQAHEQAMENALAHAFESEEEKNKCVALYREQRKAELTQAYEAEIAGLTGEAARKRTEQYRSEMAAAARDNIMAKIQMIFQDPIASINPRMTVREIIAEGMIIRGIKDKELINRKVYEMLDLVGLVQEHADRYPHEFSGGQRQRIGIARAIIMEPELIIADEPISALDVSIQAQIINLLNNLRRDLGLTILFIAHNLSVVKYFSDRIAVMYYGRIVEMASSEELFLHPLHPYTKSLLSAIPYPDPLYEKQRKRIAYEPVLAHDYSEDKPQLHEIVPGHFIHSNEAELARYREELNL